MSKYSDRLVQCNQVWLAGDRYLQIGHRYNNHKLANIYKLLIDTVAKVTQLKITTAFN